MGRIARALFTFSREQERFARSLAAFQEGAMRRRSQQIGESFVDGYHAALEESRPEPLAARLSRMDSEQWGFAYEGAGLGLSLLDALLPGRRSRLAAFLRGPGAAQVYMLHVGAGWTLARLPVPVRRFQARLDPLCRWIVLDGFGFHEAFYRWRRTVERREVPARISGYAARPFDFGLGRRLWFTPGEEIGHIPRIVATFPASRQGDLWSGIGEACTFAGGRGEDAIRELRQAAGPFAPQLGQGAVFVAKVRARAGNPAAHSELACRLLCGMSAGDAAALADETLAGLPPDGEIPAFEVWRRRIQDRLGKTRGVA
jgi:enediyne biosynthesis protein E3